MKKQEITLNEFMQTEVYESLKLNINNDINHNNVMFNIGLKQNGNYIKLGSNLIDYSGKDVFIKNKAEKKLIKEIKHDLKSKAFHTVAKMQAQREVLVQSLINHSLHIPNWNLKVIIK